MSKPKKEITFVYTDSVQRQVFEMIAAEASKRGYETRVTDDKFAKCEIGWYCDHWNPPQFSKFSVIMLHDITQMYMSWPDIWFHEPWDKYDIGFLPSKIWVDNWNKCSQLSYTNPRRGVYLTGWPKADRIAHYTDEAKRKDFATQAGLDTSKRTVLYAPAWENDHKQDDFVQAMMKLDVNIVVKQYPAEDPSQSANIREMYELHKGNPRVVLLDPHTNILDAIAVSDVLVSEESSTMTECVMMGKPAISVSDWLIPDVTPSRYPSNEYDYVVKTKKKDLTECVRDVLQHYDEYAKQAQKYSDEHFANIGRCIPMMLDILDAVIEDREPPQKPLTPRPRVKLSPRRYIRHKLWTWKFEIAYNYCMRYRPLKFAFWVVYQKLRGRS